MNEHILKVAAICLTAWAVNLSLRALPFVLFGRKNAEVPSFIGKMEKFISPVVIAGLVVYSYSGLLWQDWYPYAAGALTVALQLAFRNPLLSIIAGTALYMFTIA